jgi:tetratricopeptide (TPR) repeat protein
VSTWKTALHDLGEAEVKHGVHVHLYNLYTEEAGNRELPQKLHSARTSAASVRSQSTRKKISLRAGVVGVIAALLVGGFFYYRQSQLAPKLSDKDTIILADFDTQTGDPGFDRLLRERLNTFMVQSPSLNVLSPSQVDSYLRFMTLRPGTKLSDKVALELCQRASSKAYITGSIGILGNKQYTLELKAVNCQTGDPLVEIPPVIVPTRENVPDSLDKAASELRGRLVEKVLADEKTPRAQNSDVPLKRVTTPELKALKAFSDGRGIFNENGAAAALPYDKFAISEKADPNFAMGYYELGKDYSNLGELERASENYARANQLLEHTSSPIEKMVIYASYFETVKGDLDKANTAYEAAQKLEPAGMFAFGNTVYAERGRYDKAADMNRVAVGLRPDLSTAFANLAYDDLGQEHYDDARQIIHDAQAKKLDNAIFHHTLYALAFLKRDSEAMAEQQGWFKGQSEYQNYGFALESDTEAYAGRVANSRDSNGRAIDSAIQKDHKENGAIYAANFALQQAAYGLAKEAQKSAGDALRLAPESRGAKSEAALAFAMVGDTARAESLIKDLDKSYHQDTQMQSLWLPAIKAQLALDKKDPDSAVKELLPAETPEAIQFGQIPFVNNISCLYPTYVRGQAYLAARQGQKAAKEFEKIIDRSGIVWNCWTGALAQLGKARAYALSGDTAEAKTAYEAFFTLWKDADKDANKDPVIPIMKDAVAEYKKLK